MDDQKTWRIQCLVQNFPNSSVKESANLNFSEDVRSRFNPELWYAGIVITMRATDSEVLLKHEDHLRSIYRDVIFPSAIPWSTSFDHEPVVDSQGRMGVGQEKAHDPAPDGEAIANEVLWRLSSLFRVSQGKLSTTDDASSEGASNERPEVSSPEGNPTLQPVDEGLDYGVGC